MTTLIDRTKTALLVVDVQNGVVDQAYARDQVVSNISSLVDRARSDGVAVVWVRHTGEDLDVGSEPWQIVAELIPTDGEPVVDKRYGDSFEDSTLEEHLRTLGVGRLVVVGAQSDACIRSTIHGAFVRGYDTTLVADAHTTEDLTEWGAPPPKDVIAHTNLYWSTQSAPGRVASTVTTSTVIFEASA